MNCAFTVRFSRFFLPRSHDSVPQIMSGLMYSRAVLNSALFSFTLRQFMLRILRFCFFGRSYGHSLVVVLKSLSDKIWNGIGWYGFIGLTTSTTDISLVIDYNRLTPGEAKETHLETLKLYFTD